MTSATPKSIDAYIAACAPDVQSVLAKIRATIRKAAPEATETISYQMPTFMLGGVLIHFAAFKKHIGIYPPVRGDEKLMSAVAVYANDKGNLRFPLDAPIPYALITRIVKARVREKRDRSNARRRQA